MAYSYVKYTGNGVTTNYSIPFTYLSKNYLEIKVNNVLTTAYTLPSASTIAFTVAPPNGQIVELRRNTPKNARLVDFQDASILTEAALDLDSDQAFHITQETQDLAVDGVGQAVIDAAAASATSASNAATSAANAALSYDSFDDRYLGPKATDPTLDNDGAALLTGAIYWSTASNTFKAWTGTAWATFTVNAQPLHANLTALAGGNATIAWPVGSVYTSIVATNPATLLGGGTWVSFGAGRVLVGLDATQTEFNTVEGVGGAKTHTLSTAEMPAHTHPITAVSDLSGVGTSQGAGTANQATFVGATASTGGGGAHNNLQPYIVVYFWKRTA